MIGGERKHKKISAAIPAEKNQQIGSASFVMSKRNMTFKMV